MNWSKLKFPQVSHNTMIEQIMAGYRDMVDEAGEPIFKSVERAAHALIDIQHEDSTPMARFYTEEARVESRTVGHQMTFEYEYPTLNIELIYYCADDKLAFADHRERFAHYVLSKMQAPDDVQTDGATPETWWGYPAQTVYKKHEKMNDPGFYKTTLTLATHTFFNETV